MTGEEQRVHRERVRLQRDVARSQVERLTDALHSANTTTEQLRAELAALVAGRARAWDDGWAAGIAHASSVHRAPTEPDKWVTPDANPYAADHHDSPPGREKVATIEALDALPVGARVGCKAIRSWEREIDGLWVSPEDSGNPALSSVLFRGHGDCPLTVLHRPHADALLGPA